MESRYVLGLGNRPLTDEEFEQAVADYERRRVETRTFMAGARTRPRTGRR